MWNAKYHSKSLLWRCLLAKLEQKDVLDHHPRCDPLHRNELGLHLADYDGKLFREVWLWQAI